MSTPTTDIPLWMALLQTANFLLSWGIALFVWIDRRRNANSKRLTDIEARLTKIETASDPRWEKMDKRLLAIEVAVKNPGVCGNHARMEKNDTKLFERLDGLHGDIKELSGGVKGLTATLDLINQHLLNGGR